MEITHIHSPLSCPNPLPMQTDRRPHFSNCGDICRFYDPFVPSTYSIKCHAMLSTHSRTEMYFVPVPGRFRDCSKKTRRGKRDRVPNHHALVSVFVAVAVAVALFFSGVRKSPIYHRRLRNRVCTRKKKKGGEGKERATRHKKVSGLLGQLRVATRHSTKIGFSLPPITSLIQCRRLWLWVRCYVATACGRSLTLTSKALSVTMVLLLF